PRRFNLRVEKVCFWISVRGREVARREKVSPLRGSPIRPNITQRLRAGLTQMPRLAALVLGGCVLFLPRNLDLALLPITPLEHSAGRNDKIRMSQGLMTPVHAPGGCNRK